MEKRYFTQRVTSTEMLALRFATQTRCVAARGRCNRYGNVARGRISRPARGLVPGTDYDAEVASIAIIEPGTREYDPARSAPNERTGRRSSLVLFLDTVGVQGATGAGDDASEEIQQLHGT